MGIFGTLGSKNEPPVNAAGDTLTPVPGAMDGITPGTPPAVAPAEGAFQVPITGGDNALVAPGTSTLPVADVAPVIPAPEAQLDAPDPLAGLNTAFASEAPTASITPTVISPDGAVAPALNPFDGTPAAQEDVLASVQDSASSDGSLPAALVADPVLGTQEPAITTAMANEAVGAGDEQASEVLEPLAQPELEGTVEELKSLSERLQQITQGLINGAKSAKNVGSVPNGEQVEKSTGETT